MSTAATYQQPWTGKAWIEILFILLPPFACLACIMLFPQLFQNNKELKDFWWVILVLLVDVAHVYSTLYRTYFDKAALQQQQTLLYVIPLGAYAAGVLVYAMDALWFWRILAYVAVFHFIRQQYGFMRLYSRKETNASQWFKSVDTITIYTATIYPILYWHLGSTRNFNWFIEGDFLSFPSTIVLQVCTVVYFLIIAAYSIKEVIFVIRYRQCNIPRILIITGTIISWYFGIVYYNGDMTFTLLNVVSHGIPYMALIWLYGIKNYQSAKSTSGKFLRIIFSRYGILLFLIIIFLLAYIEEGLWDRTLWKEHYTLFSFLVLFIWNSTIRH